MIWVTYLFQINIKDILSIFFWKEPSKTKVDFKYQNFIEISDK